MSIFRLSCGLLTLASLAVADSLDVLNNRQGQTPCCVVQQLLIPCQGWISSDCNGSLQASDVNLGSMCTCNTVVYNLWSACLDIRNETAPTFDNWTTPCQTTMTNITNNDYPLHNDAKGVDIPPWAYISLRGDSTFDLGAALGEMHKNTGWSIVQIIVPIIACASLIFTGGALFLLYRRRTHRNYSNQGATSLKSNVRQLRSSTDDRLRESWTIDDFEPGDSSDGRAWLSSSTSPQRPVHRFKDDVKRLWRNPFKRRPVRVVSIPPRQGFRVDDVESSDYASNPVRFPLNSDNSSETIDLDNWSILRTEEILASQDEGADESSVLLISRAPGVNFDIESEYARPAADVHVTPPSREPDIKLTDKSPISPVSSHQTLSPINPHSLPYSRHHSAEHYTSSTRTSHTAPSFSSQDLTIAGPYSFAHSRNQSSESIIRPARTDPIMLFPSSVRAAGYNGITNPYSSHDRSNVIRQPT